ncbi:hypothetical protein PMKS-001487 [Pichia membranifaciens]|uniref:FAD synthase n=1 Tax=Pichia membranifaciens TaxID=4926 RepID=A0A1Q2YEQ3_9ASCO|nr:hypothetical protein PMKS-001487 [Pichia membranifaciens]
MCNAFYAAKVCHDLVQSFLASSPTSSLYSLKSTFDKDNNSVLKLHNKLQLPTLYPSSFNATLHESAQTQVQKSYNDFLSVLSHWDLEQLSISYNGGKDCLVQLIIYLAAIYQFIEVDRKGTQKEPNTIHVNAVYVHTENEFEDQLRFLEKSVLQYGLDFTAVYTTIDVNDSASSQILRGEANDSSQGRITCLFSPTPTLPCGFLTYLKSKESVKAIVVGIRRTDPYGATLKLEQKTDTHRGWPDFMRINPILEWHTSDVWYFIKWLQHTSSNSDFAIDYCSLYNDGYTSLGGCGNTVRNPQLKRKDSKEKNVLFWPAWWILDDDIERLSRVQKGKV